MKVLAIESSCDDTSFAVVNDDKKVDFHETINHRKFHRELNVIGQAPVKCQPMQVCMTSSREFLVRDWQSGIPEFGEFSGKL